MPRWRSSGALSIDSNERTAVSPPTFSASTFVIAAVSVVLPWSMCPMVPTLRCGLVRSNFCFPIPYLSFLPLRGLRVDDLACDRLRHFLVPVELHGERGPALRRRAQVGCVTKHRGERDVGPDRLRVAARLEALDAPAARVEIAHHVAEVRLRSHDFDGRDRLAQRRLGALARALERLRACDLECR